MLLMDLSSDRSFNLTCLRGDLCGLVAARFSVCGLVLHGNNLFLFLCLLIRVVLIFVAAALTAVAIAATAAATTVAVATIFFLLQNNLFLFQEGKLLGGQKTTTFATFAVFLVASLPFVAVDFFLGASFFAVFFAALDPLTYSVPSAYVIKSVKEEHFPKVRQQKAPRCRFQSP